MMPARLVELAVVFYRSATGSDPVREWLRSLPAEDRRVIGGDLATLQVGWPIGMPLCRSLGGGLWELRSSSQPKASSASFTASSRRHGRRRPRTLCWHADE